MKAQARSLGIEDRWPEVAHTYADVNQMFGDIVKVTPSSKVVGDMALMMVTQDLSREDVENPKTEVAFPESVVDMMRGNLGQPEGGFPDAILSKVLKGEAPITTRPGEHLKPLDLSLEKTKLVDLLDGDHVDNEDLNGYLMYPKVFLDYRGRHKEYGPVRTLPTNTFFYGMKSRDEISVEIDPGKTLEIHLIAVGDADEEGVVRVFFELNGQPRTARVIDRSKAATSIKRPVAELGNTAHIGAPMPGVISSVVATVGQKVNAGDLLCTIEAMKMETGISAEIDGIIKTIHSPAGTQVDAKDLLIEFES